MKSAVRNPRSEGRPSPALREPPAQLRNAKHLRARSYRISGFGFLPDFGLRISDFRVRLLATAILGFTLLPFVGWLALPLVPLPEGLFHPPAAGWELLDRHGHSLREVRADGQPFTQRVAFAEIPHPLVQATLAAEDARFWRHPGVDWRATLRAAWSLVRHQRVVSGGSTITQQLIKLAQPRPRTLRTKCLEAVQALRLEQVWDKPHILSEYLNRIDYGNLNSGCAAAAEFYFGKPLRDLSVAECALLAGLPQAPTRLNPHRHFDRDHRRQQWILGRMLAVGFLTADEFARATQEPLRLAKPRRVFQAPHFVDLVLQGQAPASAPAWAAGQAGAAGRRPPPPLRAGEKVPAAPDFSPGRTLQTTLDLELNHFTEQTLGRHLARLRAQRVSNGAVVILENRTGNVLALVGSENYFAPAAGQVNGAWAPRSAGSTFKPFTYLLALERGATPATVVADVPTDFSTPTGLFSPANYNHHCYGPLRYRLALANSLNIPAVKVLAALGGPAVLQQRLQDCGLTTLTNSPECYGLGLTIGNAETRLLELANAYACLARLGEFKPYRLRPDTTRETAPGRRVWESGPAWLIADILSDNTARVLTFGAQSSLRFDFPVACKTGTSTDYRDNWALGYTPEFTVAVWVGNFDGHAMQHVSGVTGAAPLLHALFAHLHQRYGTTWYTPPVNAVEYRIHPLTGRRLGAHRPAVPAATGGFVSEKFLAHTLPPEETAADYDRAGRVRLAAEYRDWLATGDNWLADRATLDEASPELRLVFPLPGTVFHLDPDLPDHGRRLRLHAQGPRDLRWQSDSLECVADRDAHVALLSAGRHNLQVSDPRTGRHLATWIEVLER